MTNGCFLYFFPGIDRDQLKRQQVATTWLADVWRDELRTDAKFQGITKHFVQSGPTGSSGIIAAAANPRLHTDQPIGFYAEHQIWVEIQGPESRVQSPESRAMQSSGLSTLNSGLFLGLDRRYRPGPESLQRDRLISGYEVELGDGEIWTAPIIRKWDDTGTVVPNVPMSMGISPAGDFSAQVRPDVAWSWQLACDLWDARARRGMTNGEMLDGGTRFLGLNYRLGPHEAYALGLFDTDNLTKTIEAALDLPSIEAWCDAQEQKKSPLTAAP